MLKINSNNTTLREPLYTQDHSKQFSFTASDKPIHHGHKWYPFIALLCIESILIVYDYLTVAICLCAFTILFIFGFCIVENCHKRDHHIIEFNNNTHNVSIFINGMLTKRIPYDEFIRLHLKYETHTFRYCYWFCRFCLCGRKSYQTASIYAVLSDDNCYKINESYRCYKNDIKTARLMVLNANKYLDNSDSDHPEKPQLNDNLHLQQFTFMSSDKPIHHSRKWWPFIWVSLAATAFISFFGYLIATISLCAFTVVLICGFCIVTRCHARDRHTIEFNSNTHHVDIYLNELLTKSIPYAEFVRLRLNREEDSYMNCYRLGRHRYVYAPLSYPIARVYVVLKSLDHIGADVYHNKCYKINESYGCSCKDEVNMAHRMVLDANRYWNGTSYGANVEQSNDTQIQIEWVNKYEIGSFCYVDSMDCDRVYKYDENGDCHEECDTVYGVIVGVMPGTGGYKIIDLFEQRERFAEENSLTLITDENVVKEVQMLLNEYNDNKTEECQ